MQGELDDDKEGRLPEDSTYRIRRYEKHLQPEDYRALQGLERKPHASTSESDRPPPAVFRIALCRGDERRGWANCPLVGLRLLATIC